VEAVFVTMSLLDCDLGEAQRAFFTAPCRDAERRFHNEAMDALAEAADTMPDDARDGTEMIALPDRDAVLAQAIPFNRDRWILRLADPAWWPAALDECPRDGRWPKVDRKTVFRIAAGADTVEGCRHLLVASLVWGSGTMARTVSRRARIFRRSSPADIDDRLGKALDVLHTRGSVEAYWAFNSDQWIPYLGPAFFTKVLYFAGHDAGADLRPVILDSVVTRALRADGAVDSAWPKNGWTTPQYKRYLEGVGTPSAVRCSWTRSRRPCSPMASRQLSLSCRLLCLRLGLGEDAGAAFVHLLADLVQAVGEEVGVDVAGHGGGLVAEHGPDDVDVGTAGDGR
jgi:hypothetical protein